MPTLVEELSARAKALPAEGRARLAEELLDSLEGEPDVEAEAAWDREIERRVAEIESGSVELIASEDVHAEARRLIRRRESSGITLTLAPSSCIRSFLTSASALGSRSGTTRLSIKSRCRPPRRQQSGHRTRTGHAESSTADSSSPCVSTQRA